MWSFLIGIVYIDMFQNLMREQQHNRHRRRDQTSMTSSHVKWAAKELPAEMKVWAGWSSFSSVLYTRHANWMWDVWLHHLPELSAETGTGTHSPVPVSRQINTLYTHSHYKSCFHPSSQFKKKLFIIHAAGVRGTLSARYRRQPKQSDWSFRISAPKPTADITVATVSGANASLSLK